MATTQRGLRPVKYLSGAPWSGQVSLYAVATNEGTAIGVGDLVKINGGATATTEAVPGVRFVSRITATTDAVCGVFVGKRPASANQLTGGATPDLDLPAGNLASASAGVVQYIYVVDDPNVLFEAQEDADTTPLGATSVGLNISPLVAAASTVTGISTTRLDSSTASTTGTLSLKLIEYVNTPDNIDIGTAGSRWIVKINNHQLGAGTGTAGV